MRRYIAIFLGAAGFAFVVIVGVLGVPRVVFAFKILDCEIVSWHDDVLLVSEEIGKLEGSLRSFFLPPRDRYRIHGLMGDLAMATGDPVAAAEHYAEEFLGAAQLSNPELYEQIREDPKLLNATLGPKSLPVALLPPAPFDLTPLTRNIPAEIPLGQNVYEMADELPEISHNDELLKIIRAGPSVFHENADHATELLRANEAAIAAFSTLGDRYRHYRHPAGANFVRLDMAANLFMVRLLAAWHSKDEAGVVENHKRTLQMAELAASDGCLVTALIYLAVRGFGDKNLESLLDHGLGGEATASGLLSNLKEYPLNRACLHPVAASEFVSLRAAVLSDLDEIVVPGEGLATVENFREQWIREFDEDLSSKMFKVHLILTESIDPEDFEPEPHEAIFAEAARTVRPALYFRYGHSNMSEDRANLIRTYAACRLSAKLMSAIVFPDAKRIVEAMAERKAKEATLLAALENLAIRAGSGDMPVDRIR